MKRDNLAKKSSDLLRYSSIGIEMGAAVVIGLLGGLWIDRRFHTRPLFTIICSLLGIAAGFKSLINLIIKESRKE